MSKENCTCTKKKYVCRLTNTVYSSKDFSYLDIFSVFVLDSLQISSVDDFHDLFEGRKLSWHSLEDKGVAGEIYLLSRPLTNAWDVTSFSETFDARRVSEDPWDGCKSG